MSGELGPKCQHCGERRSIHSEHLCHDCHGKLQTRRDRLTREFMGNRKIAEATENILEALGIDWEDDQNFQNTPNRVARAFMERNQRLLDDDERRLDNILSTEFTSGYSDFVIVDPIRTASLCSHHLETVVLNAYIGYIPDEEVVGLSKIPRAVEYLTSRPTLQEDITGEIADVLDERLNPQSLIVHVEGEHHCLVSRGAEEKDASMTTTALRGDARENKTQVDEFFSRIDNR